MHLAGKHILIGVTGSIAAYKTPDLVRLFVKEGADVRVVLSPSAADFVSPLSLATVSRHPVQREFVNANGEWNNHVELGLWADYFLVAPATANTLAKMAHGLCDNLLTAVFLSARCPVALAPAMDIDMYAHPATQQNLRTLKKRGARILGPAHGDLASGLTGEGRMEEPEVLFAQVLDALRGTMDFLGRKVLVTAGPTQEPIDPVRYISNRSSGKMGIALAEEFARRGAEVVLVSGPVSVPVRAGGIRTVRVATADEMYKACLREWPSAQACVMAAAVADYAPASPAKAKIKKEDRQGRTLTLQPTTDILRAMGAAKKKKQVLAGFALETDRGVAAARKKLNTKNLDFIVLNTLKDAGAGFETETNKITILEKGRKPVHFPLKDKRLVAADIADKVRQLL